MRVVYVSFKSQRTGPRTISRNLVALTNVPASYHTVSLLLCKFLWHGNMSEALESYRNKYSFARGASRRNEAGNIQLQKALAEIDGLFAGLNFLDRIESSTDEASSTASPPGHPTTRCSGSPEGSFDDGIFEELEGLTTTSQQTPNPVYHDEPAIRAGPERLPPAFDWTPIQNVRDGMEVMWKNFEAVAQDINSPQVNDLQQYYGTARTLRETGVFAFRSSLTGPAPNTLKEVFAFTSLAYVVQSLLRDRGRLKPTDILDGISMWMNAISDTGERQLFQKLARRLWPEAHNHLHFIPLLDKRDINVPPLIHRPQPQFSRNGNPCVSEFIGDRVSRPLAFQDSQEPMFWKQNHTVANEPGFPSWPMHDQASVEAAHMTQATYSMSENTHESWQWNQFLPLENTGLQQFDFNQNNSGLAPKTSHARPPEAASWQAEQQAPAEIGYTGPIDPVSQVHINQMPITTSNLQATKMFCGILILFEILGELPFLLSGRGLTAKGLKSFNPFSTQQKKQIKQIRNKILKPLKREEELDDPRFRALLSMSKQLVHRGNLQSIDETRSYLVAVGKVRQRRDLDISKLTFHERKF